MTSIKQIEANRRNALKSTGPTTPEGKERSRGNAVRHGLTAETIITPLEDAQDYQAFEAGVIADYDAERAVERELVLRLASVLWRLRRATGVESALFEFATAEPSRIERAYTGPALVGGTDLAQQNQLSVEEIRHSDAPAAGDLSLDAKKDIGDLFLRLAAVPTFPLDRLSRYEHMLWRQARQILFTLESMRRRTRSSGRSRFPFPFRTS